MIVVMHSIKGGLVAHTYAFAASNNDSGARKSRIRRSKEERKDMVESFIKKYQISNDGNFPSLNLTHKEVGGSFYTVREIVREIIQENRVLAPPKEQDQFDFLEQNPLGSISVEPEVNFSISHGLHSENGSVKYQVQDENIFSSVTKFHETDAPKLENELMGPEKDGGSDSTGHALPNHSPRTNVATDSNSSGQSHQPKEIIAINEAVQENAHNDKPHMTDDVHINSVENIGKALEFDHDSSELGNQKVLSELRINQDLTAEKTKEFPESIIYKESKVEQIVDTKTSVSNDGVQSKDVEPLATSNVVVEIFPLRPIVRTVTVTDDDKHAPVQGSSVSGNKNGGESLKHSSSAKSTAVNVRDHAAQLESKDYFPSREKVTSLQTEHSNTVGSKDMEYTNALANQSGPTLDRVHLETWKGTSKKLTEPETNPLLAFVKALVSAWEKLWS